MTPLRATLLLALAAAAAGGPLSAQPAQGVPDALQEVGVTQRLDAQLPLDLEFFDENGRPVELGSYFESGRPVLLSLVYYRCPMLCNLVLDGLVDTLRQVDGSPGEQFEIITISIDPGETAELAARKKRSYIDSYGRPDAARGWHFLTGPPSSIEALADAVGFRYNYLPEEKEFAHPAALFVITPDGRVSRYLFGVRHDPRTLRLSLVEASEGKVGSVIDQVLLYCFRYDPQTGRYTPMAWNLMRAGGLLTVLILGSVVLVFLRRESGAGRAS